VEEGADHGNRTNASDGLPAGADGGLDDVCGQLKSEPSHQPAGVAQPCLPRKLITQWLETRTSDLDRYLDCPDDNHEQCQRVDQRDRRFTEEGEPLSHTRYSSPYGVFPQPASHSHERPGEEPADDRLPAHAVRPAVPPRAGCIDLLRLLARLL